jgi:hypothetical protein
MGQINSNFKKWFFWGALSSALLMGCDKGGGSFSLLPDGNSFQQNSSSSINNKIDVLFVVDNSGSMSPAQTNLVNNFHSFISNFMTKGYDFQIAVTTTDAYLAGDNFYNKSASAYPNYTSSQKRALANFKGPIITPSTPNIESQFVSNAAVGDQGDGDERAFSSFREALNRNPSFHRPDAFLAVIILSDEDDFSDPTRSEASWTRQGGISDHNYNDPGLESVATYVNYLDMLTGSTTTTKNYNVSAIATLDSTCKAQENQYYAESIIGKRYKDLANQTNGVLGSICDTSFADSLVLIETKILELSTQFYLTRAPDPATIIVHVNGATVAESATNGWTYQADSNSIIFHGTAIPPQGASINVDFQPLTAQN